MTNVRLVGEWGAFDLASAVPFMPSPEGDLVAPLSLRKGLWAYKIVYDRAGATEWILDPSQGRRKYVGGVENSAVLVPDCRLPTLSVEQSQVTRRSAGQGSYEATLLFHDGVSGAGPSPSQFSSVLEHEGTASAASGDSVTVDATGKVSISLRDLPDGKYRLTVQARTRDGLQSEPLRLVFWIEPEAYSWKDALIYMIVTDRYRDGDPSNNLASPTKGADPRGDYMGGDLQGVRQAIADGTLDKLGVRALWLTPFATGPALASKAGDGIHGVTGYHGYWPIKGREVDPRIGGAAALRAMVIEAHKHGIRVLADFVAHHVHQEHEYLAVHPEWFRRGCVCGTDGCDFTEHALDCSFADYLPNIDYTVPAAADAIASDAVYWLDTFDLDGLRVDAVKHVPELAIRNLAATVRETFEASGTRMFLMGETAMGWNDCDDPCNDPNYGTIGRLVDARGLDGQIDFVLYHAVSYRTFAYGDKGMLHADYWVRHGLSKYPSTAIMTPYLGSHDTPRFLTLADYRGQDSAHDRAIPSHQWSQTAAAPIDAEPFQRTKLGLAWLLGLPGAPLLYYGDEYGQWGGADPNSRLMHRSEKDLTENERATLAFTRQLGMARKNLVALRRGEYVSLAATEDSLVFGRRTPQGDVAIVGLSRSLAPVALTVDASTLLGLSKGTVLHDALLGPDMTVADSGSLVVTIPPSGVVILAP